MMPNALTQIFFFFRLLTGIKINDINDTVKAIDMIHSWGIKTVVMSSSTLGKGTNTLVCVGSRCTGELFIFLCSKSTHFCCQFFS